MKIGLKRAYERPSAKDGDRFLIDRLWPRGIKKEELALTRWIKEAAPSEALRRWFNHDRDRWETFRKKYREELKSKPEEVLQPLFDSLKTGRITLIYAAKDKTHNQAIVLREFLEESVSR